MGMVRRKFLDVSDVKYEIVYFLAQYRLHKLCMDMHGSDQLELDKIAAFKMKSNAVRK